MVSVVISQSSTYLLVICSKSDYDDWANKELYFNNGWNDCKNAFVSRDKAIQIAYSDGRKPKTPLGKMPKDELDEYLAENCYIYSHDEYLFSCVDFQTYKEEYISEHGDEIVVFGYYCAECMGG